MHAGTVADMLRTVSVHITLSISEWLNETNGKAANQHIHIAFIIFKHCNREAVLFSNYFTENQAIFQKKFFSYTEKLKINYAVQD